LDAETSGLEGSDRKHPTAMVQRKPMMTTTGIMLRANLTWFKREQSKIRAFDDGVFIFVPSAALVFDQLIPVLWVFAVSQVFCGRCRS